MKYNKKRDNDNNNNIVAKKRRGKKSTLSRTSAKTNVLFAMLIEVNISRLPMNKPLTSSIFHIP